MNDLGDNAAACNSSDQHVISRHFGVQGCGRASVYLRGAEVWACCACDRWPDLMNDYDWAWEKGKAASKQGSAPSANCSGFARLALQGSNWHGLSMEAVPPL